MEHRLGQGNVAGSRDYKLRDIKCIWIQPDKMKNRVYFLHFFTSENIILSTINTGVIVFTILDICQCVKRY